MQKEQFFPIRRQCVKWSRDHGSRTLDGVLFVAFQRLRVFHSLFQPLVVCAISAKFRVLVQEFELINEGMIAWARGCKTKNQRIHVVV